MKTLKIPDDIHREVKRHVAENPNETMEKFAGNALIHYLLNVGHKFSNPKTKSSNNKKSKQ